MIYMMLLEVKNRKMILDMDQRCPYHLVYHLMLLMYQATKKVNKSVEEIKL